MLQGASHSRSVRVPNDDFSPEERWPGVTPAYDFVRMSYDWMMHRLNAVESRIQTLMMFSASFTVTVPVIVASLLEEVNLGSAWLVAAMVLALLNVVIGAVARAYGEVKLLRLNTVYDDWLGLSLWEFRKRSVDWAGRHFDQNRSLVNRKGQTVAAMTVIFLVEAALMLVWGLGEAGA